MYMKEAYFNPRQESSFADKSSDNFIPEIAYAPEWSEYNMYNDNTDWVDAVTQFGVQQSHSINISGGGEKATFRISGGYDTQSNYIIKQGMDRFTTRVALDYNVSDRIKVRTNFDFNYTNRDLHNTGDAIGVAQPTSVMVDTFGTGKVFLVQWLIFLEKSDPGNLFRLLQNLLKVRELFLRQEGNFIGFLCFILL